MRATPHVSAALARRFLRAYPQVFFACHSRHVRDPRTGRVLTDHLVSLLDHLDRREPLGLGELARHMGVTPGTMSVQVDRLVEGGFVARRPCARDRRAVELRLTAAGERMRRARSVLDPARVTALLERLSPDQRRASLEALETLAGAARALMDEGESSPAKRRISR